MRRGTTPTVSIDSDIDLSSWDVFLTFKWNGGEFEVTKPRLAIKTTETGSTVSVMLTQTETLQWANNTLIRVQFRAKKDGKAIASEIGSFHAEEILKDGEI